MKKEIFNEILSNLTTALNECKEEYKFVVEGRNFGDLTMNEFKHLMEISKTMSRKQDVVFTDFRHIISMGSLTASQLSKLYPIFTEYSHFRPIIHWFTYYTAIPAGSIDLSERVAHYDLQVLGQYTLYSNGDIEEKEIIPEAISQDSIITNKLPDNVKDLFVCNKKAGEASLGIVLTQDHIRDFEIIARQLKGDGAVSPDTDAFYKLGCLEKNPTICGVAFSRDNEGLYHATVGKNKTPKLYELFKESYNV